METDEKSYTALQQHLDNQAVGFPATRSNAEIRILKHIFSPGQARIATCLRFKPERVGTIYGRARHLVDSPEELSGILNGMEEKGGLEVSVKDGRRYYSTAPLVVGMYEYQLGRLTPEFMEDFKTYTSDLKFGVAFLSTKLPQMRTIPIAKSLSIKSNVSTFDEVTALLKKSNGNLAVCDCICRKKKSLLKEPCQVTDRTETCLAMGDFASTAVRIGMGRAIDMDEAMSILEQNQQQGLILQPSNTQDAEFICSCCGCCCGMLQVHKSIPKPVEFWASNFYAQIDTSQCSNCGVCEKKCQVNAVKLSGKTRQLSIDLNRCIGCGVCVQACPQKAVTLRKKSMETTPPVTREALYDIIMSHKKGTLGKLKLVGKLIVDAVLTGQTHLLR